ncbi:MAG: glycosyltransferase family 39 protein, partial [Planctomycetota bacterium]|nr:glycosyltransferase family 39 protein [Planctomycetota bacterium]
MKTARIFAFAWAAALAAVWLLRPPLTPDELRYLSVAWEMHDGNAWLVPLLNGEAYAHKPPLMFWLWRIAWLPFGPSLLAARALQAVAALLTIGLTARLARALAPESPRLPRVAALVLGGSFAVQVYSGFLAFDLWLSVGVLIAWLGLVRAVPPPGGTAPAPLSGWSWFALGLGAALLTKGPAALLAILPPALLHPWWSGARERAGARWLGLAAAALAGSAIALAWALPAASAGGAEYGNAILWGQTAGRVRDSFAHAQPLWFYLPVLPAMLMPWMVWPRLWRRGSIATPRAISRFALAVVLPGLIAFSVISGKQPHYLLPLLPAAALLIAVRLLRESHEPPARIARWALAAPLLALFVNLGFSLGWGTRWTLQPAADAVANAQREGREVALFGMAYHGQFHFLSRLRAPIADPPGAIGMRNWLREHPEGLVALVEPRDGAEAQAASEQPVFEFGTRRLRLWRAADLAALGFPPKTRTAGSAEPAV